MFHCDLVFLLLSIFLHGCVSVGSDTLSTGQSLLPGETLTSREGKFELGFFSPGSSSSVYVGIWYSNVPIQTVVWVANRNRPVHPSAYNNSRLEMSNGNLYIYINSTGRIDIYSGTLNATEAVLFDTGNFVLRNASGMIWQSFDNPTDTWLPGAEIGFHRDTNTESRLVSWRNLQDPGSGEYSLEMETSGGSELFMKQNGSERLWRSGVWQGGGFVSLTSITNYFNFTYVSSYDSEYLRYNVFRESVVSRIVIDYLGRAMHLVWGEGEWELIWAQPSDFCTTYASCGANAICDINALPPCSCLRGFQPRAVQEWDSGDFSGGCMRRRLLECGGNSRNANFTRVQNVRLPANSQPQEVGRSEICEFACSVDCTCSAYAWGSGGCSLFVGDLMDLEILRNNSAGVDLYVRTDSVRQPREGNINVLALALAVPIAVLLVCIVLFYFRRTLISKDSQGTHQNLLLLDLNSNGNKGSLAGNSNGEGKSNNNDLPIFSFSSITVATNNFSITNKLGEGGFGPVYKGELLNGQFVAVKRLSRRSGQGLEEFKTETELIAKLQHRNLVGILGCCIENDEKMLVYEYMPHKSLDSLLFDPNKTQLLDWRRRVQIIEGIAQGLLYLHHYSRFRIVHRDLKASNILLDNDMKPKISDFGMARMFGGNDQQANTNRIVGTYGYMSPEYAMEGLFSVKSDVFAFGVLMLEIISGMRNTGFHGHDCLSLLGYAWKLWENDRILDLVDPTLDVFSSSSSSPSSSSTASSSSSTPPRYIQIGLLCVQESAVDRPVMSDVVTMLSNEQATLTSPKHPAFTVGRIVKASSGDKKVDICSANDLTISAMEAR